MLCTEYCLSKKHGKPSFGLELRTYIILHELVHQWDTSHSTKLLNWSYVKSHNTCFWFPTFPQCISSSFLPCPTQLHQHPIVALDMSSNGRFIMSCCEQMFVVWSLRGERFQSVQTHMSPNTSAVVSPCGRFVACTGECNQTQQGTLCPVYIPCTHTYVCTSVKCASLLGICTYTYFQWFSVKFLCTYIHMYNKCM